MKSSDDLKELLMPPSAGGRLRRRRPEGGAAAVEFALVLPILVALLMGMIQFGWYFFVANSASSAAREGARRIVVGDCLGDPTFKNFVLAQAPTTTTATYSPDPSTINVGQSLTVTVIADSAIINFIPGMPSTVKRQFTARLEDKTAGTCP